MLLSLGQLVLWRQTYSVLPPELPDPPTSLPAVAIIISAKNAAHHLSRLLPALAQQDYPDFCIILADDYSSDDTAQLIPAQARSLGLSLDYFKPSADRPGKKQALQEATHRATAPILLYTDADCLPATPHWITQMVSSLGSRDLCIGYGPLHSPPTATGWLTRAEALWTAALYLARAQAGKAYMAVGRNLCVRRSAWLSIGGYQQHTDIPSGDDDLLIRDLATADNTAVCIHPDAWVYSDSAATLPRWIAQKARHLQPATAYHPATQRFLGLWSALHIGPYLLAGLLLLLGQWKWTILIMGLKYGLQILWAAPWYQRLDARQHFFLFPVMEVGIALFHLLMTPYLWLRRNDW